MGVYLQPTGFKKRSLQQIKLAFEQTFRDIYGPDIDLQPEGRTGHLIGILSKALADNWDGNQEIYSSLDPSQATGTALDVVCALTGVFRIAQAKSRVNVCCYVEATGDGTLIPAGRQVRRTRGALVFSLRTAVTVSSSACRDLYIQAADPLTPGSAVTLTTSFGTFTAIVPNTFDPTLSTYSLLADQINASPWGGVAQAYPAVSPPFGAQLAESCLRLLDTETDFGLVFSPTWETPLIGSVGDFECLIYGVETADPGEIDEIVTPEPGWVDAFNQSAANPGRLAETDDQLRIRREQLFGTGNATEFAILNAIYNRVDGVLSASIRSNRSSSVDSDGRPPKSFEVTVQGGTAAQIGKVIWDTQPAGIESAGNQEVQLTDSQGFAQVVKFTIPDTLWLWTDIRYKKYNDETFPPNGETMLRDSILTWAQQEFTVGRDIFPGRFRTPIYQVPGIGLVQIRCALTVAGSVPAFPADFIGEDGFIAVGGRNIALLASSRLTLTEGNFV